MITLSQPPETSLKKTVQELLFGLVNRDFGILLGKMSHEYGKWTQERITSELLAATGGRWICEFMAMSKPVPPVLSGGPEIYEYRHPLPIDGRWSEVAIIIRLHKKHPSRYALELVGFTR